VTKTNCDIVLSYQVSEADAKRNGGLKVRTQSVSVNIPDDFVEQYARNVLGLMTFDEAIADYQPEPDEMDEP